MKNILITKLNDVMPKHKKEHKDYEYFKRELVPRSQSDKCVVSVYEVPPGKSAYPYHYHTQNEECFYILAGMGTLKTPQGDKAVAAGDFIYFPANEESAHKLMNTSETETLVYLDFDTKNTIDVAFYPDSGKVGIWGEDTNQVYKLSDSVDYYEGE